MSRGSPQWSGIAFAFVFVLAGIGIAGVTMYGEYQDQQLTDSMETGTSTVISTDMEQATETDDGETEVEYYPRVEYEYTVDGQTYQGWRIYATTDLDKEAGELDGRDFDSRSAAENVLGRFERGSDVTVYYDPSDPSRAFLVPPKFDVMTAAIGGGFGGLFSIVGLFMVVQGFRGELDSD